MTVEKSVVRGLSEGVTESDLLDAYPSLAPEDPRGGPAYAGRSLAH